MIPKGSIVSPGVANTYGSNGYVAPTAPVAAAPVAAPATAPMAQPVATPNYSAPAGGPVTSTTAPTNFSDPNQLAAALNQALQPTPTQQYYQTRGQQMDDRLLNRGAYYVDPNAGFSPSQVEQVQNSGDRLYGSQLDTMAVEASRQSKPELSAGQTSAFNSIVSNMNRSPLMAAADRVPVLQDSIVKVRANPSDAALQLNLVYSYIQALDTYQSAVREGELALVNSIDSKVGQFSNYVTQIQDGQLVRPEVVKQMADAAENIVNTINGAAKNKAKSYESQANAQGLGEIWKRYQSGYSPSYNQTSAPSSGGQISATGGFDF